jgi:predicted lipid-binding transport protein (Tim44 family)
MPVYRIGGPPANPFARLLAGLVGVLAVVGAAFFGLFLFAAAIAVGLIAWGVIALRVWWIRRRLKAAGVRPENPFGEEPDRPDEGDRSVIEADYEVVSRDQEKR